MQSFYNALVLVNLILLEAQLVQAELLASRILLLVEVKLMDRVIEFFIVHLVHSHAEVALLGVLLVGHAAVVSGRVRLDNWATWQMLSGSDIDTEVQSVVSLCIYALIHPFEPFFWSFGVVGQFLVKALELVQAGATLGR